MIHISKYSVRVVFPLAILFSMCSAANAETSRSGQTEATLSPTSEIITDLSTRLRTSSSEKVRVAAALSLGKIRAKRSAVALRLALQDRSPTVRAVAASALAIVGDSSTIPSLHRAMFDSDAFVRQQAMSAIAQIRSRTRPLTEKPVRRSVSFQVAARETAILTPPPQFTIVLRSKAEEQLSDNDMFLRQSVLERLTQNTSINTDLASAKGLALPQYSLDISVAHLQQVNKGDITEIRCVLRVAVSNQHNKLLSLIRGGATVQIPTKAFHSGLQQQLQHEALDNAAKGIHDKLVAYLLKLSSV